MHHMRNVHDINELAHALKDFKTLSDLAVYAASVGWINIEHIQYTQNDTDTMHQFNIRVWVTQPSQQTD